MTPSLASFDKFGGRLVVASLSGGNTGGLR